MKISLIGALALVVAVGAGGVRAEEFPVQASGGAGRPGDRVVLQLTYDYGSAFNVIAEDFALQYPQAALSFLPDASMIDIFGAPLSLTQYVNSLRQFAQAHFGSVLENPNPVLANPDRKGYAFSFFTADGTGHPRSGLVHLQAAFDLLPSAPVGNYTVSFDNSVLVNDLEVEHFYPSALQSVQVQVLAVPEPSSYLMIAAGLLLICRYSKRRFSACV